VKPRTYWSDPVWRTLRITSFVTGAAVLILLAAVLSGASSWHIPLEVAVVANIVVVVLVLLRLYELRHR
jgi:hypothetical protein